MRNDEVISLINPYKDKLYRFALSILHNVYDAEDVMQELLVRIWKKRDEFVELENKQAWCMTVTRNLAIDKIRKNFFLQCFFLDHLHKLCNAII